MFKNWHSFYIMFLIKKDFLEDFMNFRVIFKPGLASNRRLIQIIALSLTIALLFSTAILGSACKKKTDTGIAEGARVQEGSISNNGSSKETNSYFRR